MKILGIFAHPDDEIIFGWPIFQNSTISKHAIYMTGNSRRCAALNQASQITNFTWECAQFTDLTLSNFPNDVKEYIEKSIKLYKPDFIYCHNPDGEYGHPDHKTIFEQTFKSKNSKNILISDIVTSVKSSKWKTLNQISDENLPYYKEIICKVIQKENIFQKFKTTYQNYKCWTWSEKYNLPLESSLYIIKADKNLHRKEIITFLVSVLLNSSLIGVEIGVFKGTTTEYLNKHLSLQCLFAVDPWQHTPDYEDYEPLIKEFKKSNNLGENTGASNWNELYNYVTKKFANSNVNILRKQSSEAIHSVPENLDFIFIDGNHTYDAVLEDISLWSNKLKSGGLILGHDYTWNGDRKTKRSVCRAVDNFFSINSNQFKDPINFNRNNHINRSYDRIWWQQKK